MKTALSIGDTFKFKRGRKIYTISEIRHDCEEEKERAEAKAEALKKYGYNIYEN